jgi:chromosome segregation ATPase
VSNIDTRWEQALLNKVTSNGKRLAVVERDVKDLKSEISNLSDKVSSLEIKVLNIDEKLSHVKTNVSNLDERLSKIEKIIDDVRKILIWVVGGIGAIILSLIANFIYANFI